jgi:hypothetical protein
MSWHYRILRHPNDSLVLHEVYCDEAGRPNRYTVNPASFAVDAEEGAERLLSSRRSALSDAMNRPILDTAEIKSAE